MIANQSNNLVMLNLFQHLVPTGQMLLPEILKRVQDDELEGSS